METIKSVLGLGGSAPTSKEESSPDQHPLSGQEPVSGQQGAGTATDPYDAGNLDGTLVHRSHSLQTSSQLTFSIGQSGAAAGQAPDSLPKASTSPESLGDDKKSSLPNPAELITASNNLEPSSKPREDLDSSPGLQGHPLPISSFTPTPTAEEVVSPYNSVPGWYSVPGRDTEPGRDTIPAQDTAPAQDIRSAHYSESAQDTIPARSTPAQDIVSAPDTSTAQLDEQTLTKDTQPQSLVPERPYETATRTNIPQEKGSQGFGEPKSFVEREAARKSIYSR